MTLVKMGCFQTERKKTVLRSTRSVLLLNLWISTVILIEMISHLKYASSEPSPMPIMAPPASSSDGSYSLFPNEDLRTGKKIRFEDDRLNRDRSPPDYYRTGDRYRSYPVLFEDRHHRPGDFGGGRYDQDRNYLDSHRTRGSRVYFDDEKHRYSAYDRYPPPERGYPPPNYSSNNYYQRPTLLQRPISPINSNYNNRPFHHHYLPEVSPGPSHSKLPVGATIGKNSGEADIRIHVFDPVSNTFGNPRNSGGKYGGGGTGNFQETPGPSPDLFLNHEQYLEYHRKIALARELEFRKLQEALGNNNGPDTKKILFASKQPFEIAGVLSPPDKDGIAGEEVLRKSGSPGGGGTKGQVSVFTGSDGEVALVSIQEQQCSNDCNNQNKKNSKDDNHNDDGTSTQSNNQGGRVNNNNGGDGSTGATIRRGQEIAVDIDSSGDDNGNIEVESENAKSQVTHIPPQRPSFISKSGRQLAYQQIQQEKPTTTRISSSTSNSSGSKNADSDANNTANNNQSNNNNGRKNKYSKPDGTDFHLSSREPLVQVSSSSSSSNNGVGQALPLLQLQVDSDGFVPNVPDFHSPGTERPRAAKLGSFKGEKSELGTEMTKSRIKNQTGNKIAIIKQQELKQRQKEKSIKSEGYYFNPNKTSKNKKKYDTDNRQNNNHDKLTTKTSSSFPNNDDTQSYFLSPQNPETFRFPVLPNKDTKSKSKLDNTNNKNRKNDNPSQNPYLLNNNDLYGPQTTHEDNNNVVPLVEETDGHFTLINLNNDQVDIHDDPFDENNNNNNVKKPKIQPPPGSLSRLSSDLDHGDESLLFLGTIDALVNKTFASGIINNPAASTNFIKVVRVRNPHTPANNIKTSLSQSNTSASVANSIEATTTADKTLSMFMAKRTDKIPKKINATNNIPTSSNSLLEPLTNSSQTLNVSNLTKNLDNKLVTEKESLQPKPTILDVKAVKVNASTIVPVSSGSSSSSSKSKGVIAKVHAHVSNCPKLQAPAEVICDIHIRERHGHPNPQLTVGWRRKYYNSTQPDVLLVLNKTQAYDDNDEGDQTKNPIAFNNNGISNSATNTTIKRDDDGVESAKISESLEDFHDKFNVTLAPGISPMLRSVLLIRGVSAPDCGNYQCEVSDGIYTLTSETLLFLCH